jgi:hypothetical protein
MTTTSILDYDRKFYELGECIHEIHYPVWSSPTSQRPKMHQIPLPDP